MAFLAFPQFIFLPIAVSFGYNKLYKNDDNLKKSVKYIFYKDYYVIKNFAGERRIDCINIEKVVEKESCFVLHLTSKLLQIMPKKVFEEKERELKKFRQLMNEYQSCKSSVRV
ncbi:YcxB family protein [Acetivibrio thermocellus]|uniref:YcxB family protein n=1 Tax=Acetivibrio thermocellus TaxID=1515 RepID=UPI000053866F|nr:YcxB family protein [Acetivibrio thermocellus]